MDLALLVHGQVRQHDRHRVLQADIDVGPRPRARGNILEEAGELGVLGIDILLGAQDPLVVGPRLGEEDLLLDEADLARVDGIGVDRESVALLRGVHAHGGAGHPVLALILLLGLVFHLDLHHVRVQHAVAVGNQRELDRAVGP